MYGALQHPLEVQSELRFLRDKNVRTVVEVGTWRGGHAALIRKALPSAMIICVDQLGVESEEDDFRAACAGSSEEGMPLLRENARRFNLVTVLGVSHAERTRDAALKLLRGRPIDYVFIDAAHDYDSVKADYELWSPLARFTGLHDVHNPEVYRFWNELVGARRTLTLWKELDGHGIGIVQR